MVREFFRKTLVKTALKSPYSEEGITDPSIKPMSIGASAPLK